MRRLSGSHAFSILRRSSCRSRDSETPGFSLDRRPGVQPAGFSRDEKPGVRVVSVGPKEAPIPLAELDFFCYEKFLTTGKFCVDSRRIDRAIATPVFEDAKPRADLGRSAPRRS